MEQDIHLLVVDDVEQNLVAMEALLARPGIKVLRARSGPDWCIRVSYVSI